MANAVNELITNWNQSANLELQGEQEQQVGQTKKKAKTKNFRIHFQLAPTIVGHCC